MTIVQHSVKWPLFLKAGVQPSWNGKHYLSKFFGLLEGIFFRPSHTSSTFLHLWTAFSLSQNNRTCGWPKVCFDFLWEKHVLDIVYSPFSPRFPPHFTSRVRATLLRHVHSSGRAQNHWCGVSSLMMLVCALNASMCADQAWKPWLLLVDMCSGHNSAGTCQLY